MRDRFFGQPAEPAGRMRLGLAGIGSTAPATGLQFLPITPAHIRFLGEQPVFAPVTRVLLIYCCMTALLVWACAAWLTPLLARVAVAVSALPALTPCSSG